MMIIVVVIGVHFRIIPTGPLTSIVEGDTLLIEGQRPHVQQRPEAVELFVRDDHIDTLCPGVDDSQGSVAGLLNHVLQFGREVSHRSSIPLNFK